MNLKEKKVERHPIYNTWAGMRQRCYNNNNRGFKDYGGRGICILDVWRYNFKEFYIWSINNGWAKGLQIDRINNDGNYEPDNCRWVTAKQNARNKRNNRFIEYQNQVKTLAEWLEEKQMKDYDFIRMVIYPDGMWKDLWDVKQQQYNRVLVKNRIGRRYS